MYDPLVEALELRNAYTPSDLERAIRYRRAYARALLAEVRALRRLLRRGSELELVRAERDPPYV